MQIEIQTVVDEETAAAITAALTVLAAATPSQLVANRPRRSAWALAGIVEAHAAQRAVALRSSHQHSSIVSPADMD